MNTDDDLGPLTQTYQTNDRQRRVRALRLLGAGAIIAPIAVVWVIVEMNQVDQSNGSAGRALGAVAALAVAPLVVGAILFAVYWFSRDEKFHLYEHCLVRETREGLEVVWWRDIYNVVVPIWSNGMVRWALGGDDGCKLKLNDGETMYITGFTEDAAALRLNIELKTT